MKDTILVIAAHPDDEVLGCGGTIARHVQQGDSVTVLVVGEGVTSRNLPPDQTQKELTELQQAITEAHKILGVHTFFAGALHVPDQQFDTIPLLTLTQRIESVIKEVGPAVVYTHSAADLNLDHQKIAAATLTALRPLAGNSTCRLLSFEIPSSTEWNFAAPQPFRPTVFTELTEDLLLKKQQALQAYHKEMRAYPHPRSPEYIRSLAVVRGSQSGLNMAEAFELCYERLVKDR